MNFIKLADYLDSFFTEKNIPGVGCAVYYKHKPVFEHYSGFSDVENQVPFGPDTIFRLYSATKLVTVTAAMQLLEAGKIKLGDPLYAYIPEYRHMTVRSIRENGGEELRPAITDITIEHLMSMTAGIGGYITEGTQRVVRDTGGEGKTLDIIRALAEEPLFFEPGTHFKYSACHDVLGALIEVLSGKRFGEYVKTNIFDRIGMKDTAFDLKDEKRFCRLYNNFNGNTKTAESIGEGFNLKPGRAYESGGGGLYSTVSDYILFTETLCNFGLAPNGERILGKQSIDELRTRRLCDTAQKDFESFGGPSKYGYSYGLGVRTLVSHEDNNSLSRNGEFGWDGARGCYVAVDPQSEVALFYAQQEGGSQWWRWHGTVRNYAYASVWND